MLVICWGGHLALFWHQDHNVFDFNLVSYECVHRGCQHWRQVGGNQSHTQDRSMEYAFWLMNHESYETFNAVWSREWMTNGNGGQHCALLLVREISWKCYWWINTSPHDRDMTHCAVWHWCTGTKTPYLMKGASLQENIVLYLSVPT